MCDRAHATYFTYLPPLAPKTARLLSVTELLKELDECVFDAAKPPHVSERRYASAPGCWKFSCARCASNDARSYAFDISRFFHSARSMVDWIAHLHEKAWMDANDFAAMMHRFRAATNSFGAL